MSCPFYGKHAQDAAAEQAGAEAGRLDRPPGESGQLFPAPETVTGHIKFRWVRLANAINEGNPHYTPYAIPDESKDS